MKKTVTFTIVLGIFVYGYITIRVIDTWIVKLIQFIYNLIPS